MRRGKRGVGITRDEKLRIGGQGRSGERYRSPPHEARDEGYRAERLPVREERRYAAPEEPSCEGGAGDRHRMDRRRGVHRRGIAPARRRRPTALEARRSRGGNCCGRSERLRVRYPRPSRGAGGSGEGGDDDEARPRPHRVHMAMAR